MQAAGSFQCPSNRCGGVTGPTSSNSANRAQGCKVCALSPEVSAGVEGSASMAKVASAICQANPGAAGAVTIVPGRLESLESLPAQQV